MVPFVSLQRVGVIACVHHPRDVDAGGFGAREVGTSLVENSISMHTNDGISEVVVGTSGEGETNMELVSART